MKIGTVKGIGVYIHWSFWLLMLVYLVPIALQFGFNVAAAAALFIAGVFASVVAHEFGHAWAASWYGIGTEDITLLPIGGVARLKRLPENPWHEIVIAVAGPAVNLVIMAVLVLLMLTGITLGSEAPGLGLEMDLILQLFFANLILFGFNLLPAFPMDGGRVLRGLLAMRVSHFRATQIAARVGRWMALLFAIVAIVNGPLTLLLVSGFIFIAGTAELLSARFREAARQGAQAPVGGQPDFGFGGSQVYTQVWPTQESRASPGPAPVPSKPDVIDAVEVRRLPSE